MIDPRFTLDRFRKYGYGLPRLLFIVLLSFGNSADLFAYLHSYRWLLHLYLGSIGAVGNVRVASEPVNVALLLVAAPLCLLDLCHDATLLVYVAKTLGGDWLAGKLDDGTSVTRAQNRLVTESHQKVK